MSKLICFDLDGTLLCDDKSVSTKNKIAIQKAIKQDHNVAIVTGRSLHGSREIIKELNFTQKGCFLISFQGNVVKDLYNNKIIYENGMTRDDTVTLLKELNSANIYAHTFNYECIISNKDTKELQKYNTIATENVTFVNEWNDLNAKTYPKIIAIDYSNTNKLQIFQDDFIRQGHTKQFDTFFSSQYFLEFCKKDSNKGNGMNALANYLNIPLRDTIAIGDERNDIPMIELAGIGCAMANAHKETKISADYVTENNNNYSGVAEVIEKYIL